MRKTHGLGDALGPGAHQTITEQTYGPVIAAITRLLDAGKDDGTIRPDADPQPRRPERAPVSPLTRRT